MDTEICKKCGGFGEDIVSFDPCSRCNGKGHHPGGSRWPTRPKKELTDVEALEAAVAAIQKQGNPRKEVI